jgi:hypothetical protein
MNDQTTGTIHFRRVIEALRGGVPNRDAVRAMGCHQDAVAQVFAQKLQQVPAHLSTGQQVPGLMVSGGFGTGKSHLLEYLEDRALGEGFVCSRVVISKETPLYDAAKLFRAAVESAVVPGRTEQTIQEVAHGLRRLRDSDEYARFRQWCNSANAGISSLFAATLFLHERLENDPELVEAIFNFWLGEPLGTGDRLSMKKVRDALRLVNGTPLFQLNAVPMRELPFERFRFTARMVSACYKGWVILIDELELIGRYSFLQRAKSYAALARWMGLLPEELYPGILTVASISDDFVPAVLEAVGGKGDLASVRLKLESRGTEEYRRVAERAEAGMQMIRRSAIELKPPNKEILEETYLGIKQFHARAYGWAPPEIERVDPLPRTPMRTHVRRWINEWDIRRLYPGTPFSIEEQQLSRSYVEDVQPKPEQEGSGKP